MIKFDTSKVLDRDAVLNERFSLSLIVQGMENVGIRRITEQNYAEFYRRYVMMMHSHGMETWLITQSTVQRFIGLKAEVSPLTPAAFTKAVLAVLTHRTEFEIHEEITPPEVLAQERREMMDAIIASAPQRRPRRKTNA